MCFSSDKWMFMLPVKYNLEQNQLIIKMEGWQHYNMSTR